jgi:secondary thiamine-phosphate synthase enzyme
MRQATQVFRIDTRGRGLYEFSDAVADWLSRESFATGLLTLLCRHTSASLLITENASPDVRVDMEAAFEGFAPESAGLYAHDDEGPDDMPAHIRAALTAANLSIPILAGKMALGTWQGLFLFEHRRRPHRREIAAHAMGE